MSLFQMGPIHTHRGALEETSRRHKSAFQGPGGTVAYWFPRCYH
jgi:hypothetical protein